MNNEIEAKQSEINKVDHNQLFKNISLLKGTPIPSDVKIFVSFFSYPTSFALYNGSFLTCFTGKGSIDLISMIAHELMHGFASNELTELYRSYISSNDFLFQNHKRLIDEFHSGDEEEFVMAAEYFLCFQTGLYIKSDLMHFAKVIYNGCCPVAMMIFDLLIKATEMPRDYNKWLIDIFKQDCLPKNNINEYIGTL